MNTTYRIAILGATSQIAKDLIISFSTEANKRLCLFARRPDEVTKWLASAGLAGRYPVDKFSSFGKQTFDAVFFILHLLRLFQNFVGIILLIGEFRVFLL